MDWKRTLAAAIILGLVAACVVWYLERFEVAQLHAEMRSYLANYDDFRAWEQSRPGADAPPDLPPEPPA